MLSAKAFKGAVILRNVLVDAPLVVLEERIVDAPLRLAASHQ